MASNSTLKNFLFKVCPLFSFSVLRLLCLDYMVFMLTQRGYSLQCRVGVLVMDRERSRVEHPCGVVVS